MTLDELKPGQSGVIKTIGGEGALRRRLLDMGLTPKTAVAVRKVAPMGDPIELALLCADAAQGRCSKNCAEGGCLR